MNGLLIVDKPAGITSHDLVMRSRRALRIKRIGHTGTLDPFATGVMVILVGNATRLAQFLDKDEKEYEAIVRFGFETDTGDRTGQPIKETIVDLDLLSDKLENADLAKIEEKFCGSILQKPPMYSAKKIGGKKLYELARKGITAERESIPISIRKIRMCPRPGNDQTLYDLQVVCSAGTYIRALAEDIGREIGVGAHLEELRRVRAGRFAIDQAITVEDLKNIELTDHALLPMQDAVIHLPEFVLPAERVARTRNGLSTMANDSELAQGQYVRMVDENLALVAIGRFEENDGSVCPKVVLM